MARPFLALALALAVEACGPAKPPNFTDAERDCLAAAELRANLKIATCGKSVSGQCSTDSIMDVQDREAAECLTQ